MSNGQALAKSRCGKVKVTTEHDFNAKIVEHRAVTKDENGRHPSLLTSVKIDEIRQFFRQLFF